MPQFRRRTTFTEANQYQGRNDIPGVCRSVACVTAGVNKPHVHTIHDDQVVLIEKGDWIIPESDGIHFYPCKPDVFDMIYEPAS